MHDHVTESRGHVLFRVTRGKTSGTCIETRYNLFQSESSRTNTCYWYIEPIVSISSSQHALKQIKLCFNSRAGCEAALRSDGMLCLQSFYFMFFKQMLTLTSLGPLPLWQARVHPTPGQRYGTWLAWRTWHLAQRAEELPCVGERGGPHQNHLHGEGWQHEVGLWSILQRPQVCGGQDQGEWLGVHVEPTSGICVDLSNQPGYRPQGWRSRQTAQTRTGEQPLEIPTLSSIPSM